MIDFGTGSTVPNPDDELYFWLTASQESTHYRLHTLGISFFHSPFNLICYPPEQPEEHTDDSERDKNGCKLFHHNPPITRYKMDNTATAAAMPYRIFDTCSYDSIAACSSVHRWKRKWLML